MPFTLHNKWLQVHIDRPDEGYCHSRFDWTAKIVQVLFKGRPILVPERKDEIDTHLFGQGLYNEFGIDGGLGFAEAEIGEWFHKIGVGILCKDGTAYRFNQPYETQPITCSINQSSNQYEVECVSERVNGYQYQLHKKITLLENNIVIQYLLKNRGSKDIITDEYVHNFIGINRESVNQEYALKFPFKLAPDQFGETVNPNNSVVIGSNEIRFSNTPKEDFFFSYLAGNNTVQASWELQHPGHQIAISETGNFSTSKVNLWGSTHVICPELFIHIHLKPGESTSWTRTFTFFEIDD